MEASATTPTSAVAATPLATAAARRASASAMRASAAATSARGDGKRKADAATTTSSSSFVFLRIKRRRNEDPVECLVVQQELEAKALQAADVSAPETATTASSDSGAETTTKKKPSATELLNAFTKLSTREKSFVFKRIDTMEKHQLEDANTAKWTDRLKRKVKAMKDEPRAALKKSSAAVSASAGAKQQSLASQLRAQQQQERLRERRKSDAQRSRGLSAATAAPVASPEASSIEIKQQQTLELPGVRVVDLETVRPASSSASGAAPSDALPRASDSVTMNGARLRPTRVLNPREREVDEAIWTAFRANDFSRFFTIFHSLTPESKLNPVAFQRPADGATILMAAAVHGRVDVIEFVLRSSAVSALQRDWEGATAATFAARAGFPNVHAALLACEDAEREKDFVYDVYCVDVSASKDHESSGATGATTGGASGDGTERAPVVAVSAAVQRWLSQDAAWTTGSDDVAEYMLASDAESGSDDDGESVDSNDENHADNDYPDEESDGSDYDSDDSEQSMEHRRIWKRRPSDEGESKDDGDY